jgi:hypothetical protein
MASADTASGGISSPAPLVPWSTSFEEGFSDYTCVSDGFCAATGSASRAIVTEPVHSGRYAAAYTVNSKAATNGSQSRCVRAGLLPKEAYYGAWYYVPELTQNTGLWNLFHLQGGKEEDDRLSGLWDVSLVNNEAGALRLVVYGFVDGKTYGGDEIPAIPIGEWFQIEMYLKRATDTSGEIAIYLNGTRIIQASGIQTDKTDPEWGQWYVGNLADALDAITSTIYVDDVSVRTSR